MSKKHFNYSKQFNKNEELTKPMQEQLQPIPDPVQEPEVPQTPVQEQPPVIRKGVVICERLNVRKGCSKDTDVVSVITKGTIVDIYGEAPDWYDIETANGKIKGYCMAQHIELR